MYIKETFCIYTDNTAHSQPGECANCCPNVRYKMMLARLLASPLFKRAKADFTWPFLNYTVLQLAWIFQPSSYILLHIVIIQVVEAWNKWLQNPVVFTNIQISRRGLLLDCPSPVEIRSLRINYDRKVRFLDNFLFLRWSLSSTGQ
jgi:hypothetical protein